jgi:hypothetical protein
MESWIIYPLVVLVLSLLYLVWVSHMVKREQLSAWEKRQELLNLGALICGKGEAALSADFAQCIFISENRDLLLILRRSGGNVRKTYIQPYEVVSVSTSHNPIEYLRAPSDAEKATLPHKMLTLKIANKQGGRFSEKYFRFGDAAVATEWKGKLEALARLSHSGHTTIAHKL